MPTLLLAASALAQNQSIRAFPGKVVTLSLAKPGENEVFAIVEVKDKLTYGPKGIVEGHNNLARIQTTDERDKWFPITEAELVNGRVVVTTEANKVYTIYDLSGFSGRIVIGRAEPKPDDKK